jgi:hypothetical protein
MSSQTESGELGSYDNLISWKSNLYIRSILRSYLDSSIMRM